MQYSDIDKYALYQIARYCDELVDDGNGGLEPRFTCNVYFQSKQEAYKVLKDLASAFRGMMYWIDGQITAVQDRPKEPVRRRGPKRRPVPEKDRTFLTGC